MKDRIIRNLKEHRSAIIVSLVIGLLVVLPTIIFIIQPGRGGFHGIYPVFNDDEVHYLAMTEEVYDGHASLGNTFIKELKDQPPIQSPAVFRALAMEARILHLSVPTTFVINDFLFPAIGLLLLYSLFHRITKQKNLALIFATSFYLLFLFSFGRPVNPQFSFIFFLIGLILIWEIYEREGSTLYLAALFGVLSGLTLYIYIYYFSALLALFGISLLAKVISKKRVRTFFLECICFLIPAALLSVPYGLNLLMTSASPFYQETMSRFGMLFNRWPACYINVSIALIGALIILISRKKISDQKKIYFAFGLSLSSVILNWQNVATGAYLQLSSHYYPVTVLFFIIVLAIAGEPIYRSFRDRGAAGVTKSQVIFIIVLACMLLYRQQGEIRRGLSIAAGGDEVKQEDLKPLFDWLNANTQPDSVVYTLGDSADPLIPVYTKNNLYSYGYAGYYLMSDREIEDRWARKNYFSGRIDEEYIRTNFRDIWLNKYLDQYQNNLIRARLAAIFFPRIKMPELLPADAVSRVVEHYGQVKKESPREALKKYTIDYLVYDTADPDYVDFKSNVVGYNFLSQSGQIGQYRIYKVD